MKNKAVTASLLAGLSLVSGAAFAQTGSVGAAYARVDADSGDTDVYGIEGEFIFDAGGGWAVIVEGDYTATDDNDGQATVETHVIQRSASNAWGVFLGVGDRDDGLGILAGFEYAQFFDMATLAFNLNHSTDKEVDVDTYGANGAYRIFIDDNLRFDVGAGVGRVETAFVEDDFYSLGVGVEYRFAGSPYSVGAAYTRIDSDVSEADVFGVTLRWNFGDTTLKAADRSGKTFTGLGSALQPF